MKKILLSLAIFLALSCQAYALDLKDLSVSGFISQGYIHTSENNFFGDTQDDGTFRLNEYGIAIGARISKRLQASIQMLSYTIGETLGGNEFDIDYAFLRYDFSYKLGVQAGQMKCPHGFFNQTRDLDNTRMGIFLPTGTYTDRSRDAMLRCRGVGIYGLLPMDFAGELSWEYLIGEPDLDDDSGTVRGWEALGGFPATISNANIDIEHNLHLLWETPLEGLALVASLRFSDLTYDVVYDGVPDPLPPPPYPQFITSTDTVQFEDIKIWHYGIKYEIYNLMLAGEMYIVEVDRTMFGLPSELESDAWYVMAQYQVLDQLGVGVYYDEYHPDTDDEDSDHSKWSEDTCLYFRYDITENWLVKLEHHWFDGTALLLATQNPNPEEDWNLFAVKLTVTF